MTATTVHQIDCSIAYGHATISYTLIYGSRKTLQIAVHPDGSTIVKAPVNANASYRCKGKK